MLRSVGSIIFGLAADRYGRKWPFIVNNLLFIVLELGTGFCSTYNQFLGVRALFGIAMGGLYGNAAATGMSLSYIEIYTSLTLSSARRLP
jgi:SHS family lactate transporter-like MFS transporter